MGSAQTEHLSFGLQWRLASRPSETGAARRHLDACPACRAVYDCYRTYAQDQPHSDPDALPAGLTEPCTEAPPLMARAPEFFARFMLASQPEEVAVELFRHLNDCYACFETFCLNWNACLQMDERQR